MYHDNLPITTYHSVLLVEEDGMFREPAEEPLKEGLVQAELSSRIARDDGSELLVVPDQHHLLRVAGHDGDHAVGLRTHAALVDHHLR